MKLTTLRHTATLLRVDAGDDTRAIRDFLNTTTLKNTYVYLSRVTKQAPPGPGEGREAGPIDEAGREESPPERAPNRFQPWETMKHGMYAKSQPPGDVAAVIAEGIEGIDEELAGLRSLHNRLLELRGHVVSDQEGARLADFIGRIGLRIGEMVVAARELAETDTEEQQWIKDVEDAVKRFAEEEGLDDEDPGTSEKSEAPGDLSDIIASTRLALRNTLRYAQAAASVKDVIHYTDLYSVGCGRLVRLLGKEARMGGDKAAEYRALIDQAIAEVSEELGLSL